MPATSHIFCGETVLLDPAGVLFWPKFSLLAVADLHLEKGSAAARSGQLVPPWDSGLTLGRLAALIGLYEPGTVVAVGDSFHDDRAASRLSLEDFALLASLTDRARFIWVRGNHDPSPPEGIAGHCAPAFEAGGLVFRHEALAGARGEVSGHFHPKARIVTRAAHVVRPCFMCSEDRIMLPSFGAYTGGLEIAAPAIARHFPDGGQAFLLGADRVFCFAVPGLVPCDALASGAGRPRFG